MTHLLWRFLSQFNASGNAIRGQTSGSTPRGTGVWNDYNTTYSPLYQIYTSSMSLLDHPNTTSQVTYNFAVSFYLWQSYGISFEQVMGQSTVKHL